ncbi:MAG: Fic family protein [Candidatus Margulisbacteria bacterium]|nr:Fic family protein [Candidatus Margulisiibacteriota bacterium]
MYKPSYRITPYLLSLIDEASQLKSWIESATINVPWLPVLQKQAKTRNTHSSTFIEGNPLNLPQVEAIARGEKIGGPEVYEKEVRNYLKAMLFAEKYSNHVIADNFILKLHNMLLKEIFSANKRGKYRDKQNYIINERGIKIFTPPPPNEVKLLMHDLIEWFNDKQIQKLHSILVCAIFHHRLVSIHPFLDGNGRMARLIGTWILYQRDYDLRHIFSLDEYFANDRRRYYMKIEQARELDNDLTLWIEYVAEGIVDTLKKVKKRIEGLQVTAKYKIALTARQEDILRTLRDKPPIGVAEFRKTLKVSRARINQILSPLVESGLIVKEGQSRATRYRLI